MQLTPEQQSIINTNGNLVINAVAGSGKTTTLIEYAKTRPAGKRILYLAFNKTVKNEAIEKFRAAGVMNVKVETAHSLAFDYVVKFSNYQVVQGYKSYELCEILDIKTGDRHTDFIIASHVNKFISYFCNSKAAKVQELNYAEVVTEPKAHNFVNNFYKQIEQFTREALGKMYKGEIAVTHDFYLKKFQLDQPVLPYDYILFDEGQDASAAMLDVFLNQQNAVKVIVGDMHQQIYGWRYAINSLQQVNFPVYNLSNSFRFDDEVALVANKILAWKKLLSQPPAVKLTGAGEPPDLVKTKATLGRTNLSLLLNAIAQWQHGVIKTIHFEGNINSYTFADEGASLYDVLSLYNGKPDKIKDKLIAGMKTMHELEEYIEKTEDNSLAMIVEVVKEFGNRLPALINDLKTNHTAAREDADMIFSTVHRCKGMEYDEVTLLNDFINETKLQNYISQMGGEDISEADKNRLAEEVNILYVAATRAKGRLRIPPDINPLRNIELAQEPAPISYGKKNYQHYKSFEDWDTYSKSAYSKNSQAGTIQKANYGKRWTDEEEKTAAALYKKGVTLKEISAELNRSAGAVRIKLINMGLLDENVF
ncbi:UvrD-helicase domain-containing protein [Foetidibacter luteolus]|uniref:UvrD-helicase domain-containing protein n=1 Tax=Foetidibacter luteolus TaxID=2608880 RepID=UPI00129AF264|nr:UvrD-helicase domain-containing protein [Foetidibacter luteolus]